MVHYYILLLYTEKISLDLILLRKFLALPLFYEVHGHHKISACLNLVFSRFCPKLHIPNSWSVKIMYIESEYTIHGPRRPKYPAVPRIYIHV